MHHPRLRLPSRACAFAALAAVLLAQPAFAQVQTGHAVGVDNDRTRFVIGLEKPVRFQVFSLSNPNRVVVELPDVKVSLPTMDGDKSVGLVKSFRGGQASADKMRVVIDVTEPVIVTRSEV